MLLLLLIVFVVYFGAFIFNSKFICKGMRLNGDVLGLDHIFFVCLFAKEHL